MNKIIFLLPILAFAAAALAQPTLVRVKVDSGNFVKIGDQLEISSVASDPDGDLVRLVCGTALGGNDICQGSYFKQNPECSYTVPWNDNTNHRIYCRVIDIPKPGFVEKTSENKDTAAISDNVPPSVSVAGASSQWFNSDIQVSAACGDSGSGCSEKRLAIFSSHPGACPSGFSSYPTTFAYIASGLAWACAAGKDNAGNIAFSSLGEVKIDKDLPSSSILCNNAECNENFQYTQDVVLTFNRQDDVSGVREVRYIIDGGQEKIYGEGPSILSTHGSHSVEYWAVDNAGNAEGKKSMILRLNKRLLTQEIVMTMQFARKEGTTEIFSRTAKIREIGSPVNFFAYISCYIRDRATGAKIEDCLEGKTRITSFNIDTSTGAHNYISEKSWSQAENWDLGKKAWRFPLDTQIYRSSVSGCVEHDGLFGCGLDGYVISSATMLIDISYPDLQNFVVPATPTGYPNFTRSMPIVFEAISTIEADDGSSYFCNGDSCKLTYSLDGGLYQDAIWDDFRNRFTTTLDSLVLSCDNYHNLNIKAIKLTDPHTGIEAEAESSFFVNCIPKVVASPIERRLANGQRNVLAFNITIWNPLDAATFDIVMSQEQDKPFVLEWLSFRCESSEECSASDDTATINVAALSSKAILVDLSIAGKSGVFPVTFTALSNGREYTGMGTLQIFAEGLSEFSMWQLFAAALIGSGFIWRNPEIIKRKKR